jgi:hypothetical protein
LKSSKITKLLGVLITLLVSISASYAAGTSDSNSNDVSDQILSDPDLSDNSGLSDDSYNIQYEEQGTSGSVILSGAGGNGGAGLIRGNGGKGGVSISGKGGNGGYFGNDSVIGKGETGNTTQDPQNAKIPMQKTGIPILPAELGIISIIGGFMINRIRS